MNNLSQNHCVPCEGGVLSLSAEKISEYLKQVPEWQLNEAATPKGVRHQQVSRDFKFKDFAEAMMFVNKVAELAEAEGHHPDFIIHWNKVRLDLWTHSIGGLFDNDFIMAAKIDKLA